jgi:hypothetical protein
MNLTFISLCAGIFFLTSASVLQGQTAEAPNPTGVPPKFFNMVRVGLKPGRGFAYAGIEAAIVRGYSAAKVEVYWLTSRSLTGPSEFLYLNFFNSFEEYEALFAKVGAALAAHPEILQMQERLQQENGSSEQTVIAVRRDDLGYRIGSIDFSKMRRLRIREFHVRPGHDGDFAEAAKIVAAAYEKVAVESPWVVYQADSGAAGSTFFVVYPMRSLADWDNVLARGASLSEAQAEIGGERLPKILLEAIASAENQMYAVAPEQSHMPKEFTDGDPDFWTPQPAPPPKPRPAASPAKPTKPSAEKKP